MKSALRHSCAITAFAIVFVATPALGQTNDTTAGSTAAAAGTTAETPDGEAAPGEIVVTAQKRAENLQTVPVAVSVLSGQELATASRPSIETASQLVPSLNFLKSGTTLNQSIFLRGVGTATFSIAGEPSVSTVVDGVVYARSGEAFSDLIDVSQIEVLRGPQGTLFGKNASAGVINITTVMPSHELGGTVQASYFDRNEYRAKAAVNLPLAPDLAARLTGFYGKYDGNIYNEAVNHYVNGYEHWGARAQLLYDPSSAVRIYATADYHKNNDNCCAEIIATPGSGLAFDVLPTPLGADTRRINQNLVTSTKEEGWGVSLQADVDVGTQTLTSITAYRVWDNTEIRDGDWLPQAYVGLIQLHDYGPQHSNTFSQELRLTSPADQTLSYVLGAYYSRAFSERVFTRNDIVCTAVTGAPTDVLIPCGSANANPSTFPSGSTDYGSTFNNFALFGQATLHLADNFRLIGGLRYTHDELSVFLSRNTTLAGPGIQPSFPVTTSGTGAPAAPFTTSTTNDNISGKAALQYDFSTDVMGYVSYARGYKGPAYNMFFNLTAVGTNVIDPETSDAYEVGLKNTLFGGKMTLNIDGFYAKYYNFQANNPDLVAGVVVTRFTNAGDVSTRGVEADLNWLVAPDFSITGGIAYTDAHVDAFKAPQGAAVILPGTPLGFAPKWKGSLSANYRWRTGSTVDAFFGGAMNFQSSQLSLFTANDAQRQAGTIPPYALVNLQAGVGGANDGWKIMFQLRNLFDQSYAAAIANGGPGGSYRYQIPRDADRYWGVTGTINF